MSGIMSGTLNPKESLVACMAFSPNDWSQHHRHAWMYGIVIGWDEESMVELVKKHGWTPDTVQRLQQLRKSFVELQPPGVSA